MTVTIVAVLALLLRSSGTSTVVRGHPNAPPVTVAQAPVPTPATTVPGDTETGIAPAPVADPVKLPGGPLAPVIYKVPTTQPVVFLTIDDGYTRDPQVIAYLQQMHLPVTVFLLTAAGREDPAYFRALQAAGATIEDHTLTHPRLPNLSLAAQKQQICGSATNDTATYGTRPTLMRPPYGLQNRLTQAAAAACGMKAVVEWTAVAANGNLIAVGGHLQAGYIVVLHFKPTLLNDLHVAVAAIQAAGLTVGRLESYLTSWVSTTSAS